jgi:Arc/MetJ-type ribon-helix-helix transcriptional regulator
MICTIGSLPDTVERLRGMFSVKPAAVTGIDWSRFSSLSFHCRVIQGIDVPEYLRNTKVYSITMPPEMAKHVERLARKENRTMSELVREALRRYERPAVTLDLREYVWQIAPTPPALRAMQEDARRNGTDKLTMAQIDREVASVRRQQSGKKKTTHAKR